jgi:hypothetical protein
LSGKVLGFEALFDANVRHVAVLKLAGHAAVKLLAFEVIKPGA